MAFKIENKIHEKDAVEKIFNQPCTLQVVGVDEIKASERWENQFYMYIKYAFEDGTRFDASYSFYMNNDGTYKCTSSSKLYALLKTFLHLNPLRNKKVDFEYDDICELLENKKFIATAVVQSIGRNNQLYIVAKDVIE